MRTPVSIGVVGLGRRGPTLARAFDELPQTELRWLCDQSVEPLLRMKARYPNARRTSSLDDLLSDETLDAVVIATPAATHYELARRALEADKHVFVEQPLAHHGDQATELVRLAEHRNRRLLVGHVLLFHPAVRRLKELIELGRLGDLYYLYGNRQTLGPPLGEESVLWSLGGQDVALVLYLLSDEPVEVLTRGEAYVEPNIADVVFCYLRFATGITAHLHLSWLDPLEIRRLTAVGSRRMAVFDDLEPVRKLTVYHGAVRRSADPVADYFKHGFGDIHSPRIEPDDPLRLECEHFVTSIRSTLDLTSAQQGAAVVRTLETLQSSLDAQQEIKAPMRPAAEEPPAPIPLPVRRR